MVVLVDLVGHTPLIASSAIDAFQVASNEQPDLVLMDLRMPGMDGLEALPRLREIDPDVYVVIMTAYGTSQTSIEAMRLGAYEVLTKPLDLDVVRPVIEKALEARALGRSVATDRTDETDERDDRWEKYPPMRNQSV